METWLGDQTTHLQDQGLAGWAEQKAGLAPPSLRVYLLNFYCELIFKVEKYSINLK